MIQKIDWQIIQLVWEKYLWPNRTSAIETNSAMVYLGGIDMENMNTSPIFFGYYYYNLLAGVNSGHMCHDGTYRSRGLYVFPEYRGMGIGSSLLTATLKEAKKLNASLVWSLPRKTSWSTYHRVGFTLSSEWKKTETSSENAYCKFQISKK
jgi:GNAT superfamily N-acetyltransferase